MGTSSARERAITSSRLFWLAGSMPSGMIATPPRPPPPPVARDVAGRLVERIVQGGGAERGQGGEAAADRLAVLGEGHDAEVTAVEGGRGHPGLRRPPGG